VGHVAPRPRPEDLSRGRDGASRPTVRLRARPRRASRPLRRPLRRISRGGVLYFRDAGFFFTPWRTLTRRLLADGLPVWNDWLSNGRPFAADPNAAVFWPLSPLLLVLSPTGLALVNLALLLVLFYAALRALAVTPLAAASGAAGRPLLRCLQTLPVFIGVPAAAAPVALAVVAFGRVGFGLDPKPLRGALLGGAALALSFLAGEPVITATGGAASVGLALSGLVVSRPPRPDGARRLAAVLAGVVLALGLSAIQLLPTLGELRRSARGHRWPRSTGLSSGPCGPRGS